VSKIFQLISSLWRAAGFLVLVTLLPLALVWLLSRAPDLFNRYLFHL
jgi:hypothetical protein